jgi:hypothetical protein
MSYLKGLATLEPENPYTITHCIIWVGFEYQSGHRAYVAHSAMFVNSSMAQLEARRAHIQCVTLRSLDRNELLLLMCMRFPLIFYFRMLPTLNSPR